MGWVGSRCLSFCKMLLLRLQRILCVYLLYKCSYQVLSMKISDFLVPLFILFSFLEERSGAYLCGWETGDWPCLWMIGPKFSSDFWKWFSFETNVTLWENSVGHGEISGGLLNWWLVLYPTACFALFSESRNSYPLNCFRLVYLQHHVSKQNVKMLCLLLLL